MTRTTSSNCETATQPLISEDEKFVLAFNGEMWKPFFKKFNKKLREKYNFKTDKSDSELLLYYLIDNRDNILESMKKLDGMFCFAFYDVERNELTLGRDFIGRLPLYYVFENDIVFLLFYNSFSSNLRFHSSFLSLKESSPSVMHSKICAPGLLIKDSKDEIICSGLETKTWLILCALQSAAMETLWGVSK